MSIALALILRILGILCLIVAILKIPSRFILLRAQLRNKFVCQLDQFVEKKVDKGVVV